jgi:hypothetical protein
MHFRNTFLSTATALLTLAGSAEALTATQASMVPGADFVATLDIKKVNEAPIVRKRRAADEANPDRSASGVWLAKAARFETATGITKDDVIAIAFSCDIDTANLEGETPQERVGGAIGILAIELAKPISIEKLKLALRLEYGSEQHAGVSEVAIGNGRGLKINASNEGDPDIYLAVAPEGHVLLTSFNVNALGEAQARLQSSGGLHEPSELAALRQTVAKQTQIQMACVVPAALRDSINAQIVALQDQAAQNPGLAIVAGIVKLFGGIKNLCAGVALAEDASITVAGDLGDPLAAMNASLLLDTMVIPMLQAKLLQTTGGATPPNLDEMAKVSAQDSTLEIRFKLSEAQILDGVATPVAQP